MNRVPERLRFLVPPAAALFLVAAVLLPMCALGGDPGSGTGSADAARMLDRVRALSAPEMEGRGPGTQGLEKTAAYITQAFREAGLQPAGNGDPKDPASWMQVFTPSEAQGGGIRPAEGTKWGAVQLRNVIGILPGKAGSGKDAQSGGPEVVVIGAHYDHLGRTEQGEVYPGADDNASGIAVLLEVASELKSAGPFERGIVFVAFSGEEEGTLGSRFYTEAPPVPLAQTAAMLNLDTVGRMEGKKLYVFGSGSSPQFAMMLRGINMGAGFELVTPPSGPFASDQIPFYEKGIPVLHFFTGPNPDYHKPTDTLDKINAGGMAALADFVGEAAAFLADSKVRPEFVPPGAASTPPPAMAGAGGPARRVSLGTIPDFSKESGGVLISGTMPGSPAEAAGFQKGDVIVGIGGDPVDNLGDFSAALKGHAPGDSVEVVFKRDGAEMRRNVRLVERK